MKGHVYKRGNTWTYVIDVGVDPATKKRKQKSKGGFRTKGDCQRAMDEIKYKITHDENYQGAYLTKDVVKTVGECVEEYLEFKKTEWKYSTYYTASTFLNKLNEIRDTPIADLGIDDFDNLLNNNQSLSYSTKKLHYSYLKTFLSYCQKKRYIQNNISKQYKIEKEKITIDNILEDNIQKFFYEKDEVNHILKQLDVIKNENFQKFQDCLIIKFGIFTGMRIGEILALEWKDIQDNIIKVYKTVNHVNIKKRLYHLTVAKTKSSIRDIPVTRSILEELEQQRRHIEAIREEIKEWDTSHDFIFPNHETGLPTSYQNFKYRYKQIIKKIGVRYLSFHKLRHTHCSLLALSNIPLHMIGARLGHSEADVITKRIYLHISKEYSQNIADKFDEVLLG